MIPRTLTPEPSQPAYGPDGPVIFGHIDAPNIGFVAPDEVSRRNLRFGAGGGAGIQRVVETGVPMPNASPPKRSSERSRPPAKQVHQIRVETGREEVTVHVGPDPAAVPPGGFAKLFNRVIDAGAWGRLTDAGRAVYLPLVRFADARAGFRVRIGQAALIRHAGLSRSSVKRGLKDLLASKLVVVAREGGVSADGRNESNVYQLLVPVDPRDLPDELDDLGEAGEFDEGEGNDAPPAPAPAPAPKKPAPKRKPAPGRSNPVSAPGPVMIPPPVRRRTPTPSVDGPTGGSLKAPEAGRGRTGGSVRHRPEPPAAGGPLYRESLSDHSPSEGNSTRGESSVDRGAEADAAAILEGIGIDAPTARRLAAAHPPGRIADALATMEHRRSLGRCASPAGFVVEALSKNWPVPAAVAAARGRADAARARAELLERERSARTARDAALAEGVAAADAAVDALESDEFDALVAAVHARHADNPAVLNILRRKPPRESRLMRAEVAAMLSERATA